MITIWAITDGKPGHDTHTRGFIRAVQAAGGKPAETHWIDAALRLKLLRRGLGAIQNASGNGHAGIVIRLGYRTSGIPAQVPDAIVSSGGDTLYLNAALARRTGTPNFFAGSLRGLSGRFFTLTTTPLPRSGEGRHVATRIPLSDFDEGIVAREGGALRAKLGGGPLWAVLVGGDGGGSRFRPSDWRALGAGLAAAAGANGARLLITTSRRTGEAGERILREGIPNEVIARATWWSASPEKVVAAYLGASDIAVCTAESMSMISEAVSARRPLIALSPAHNRPPPREADFLSGLEADRLIVAEGIDAFARTKGVSALGRVAGLHLLDAPPWRLVAEEIKGLGLFGGPA